MTKERLKEIKDSIEFQMQVQQAVGYKNRYDDLLIEEIDLYNEVIDLQEDYNKVVHESTEFESKVYQLQDRINKAIEYLNNSWQGCYTDATLKYKIEEINITELLEILKGDSKEVEE